MTRETYFFRFDADHDVSGKTVEFSIDDGGTWVPASYASTLPALVADENSKPDNAPEQGMTGYWFKVLLGQGVTNGGLAVGDNQIVGRLKDGSNPTDEWVVRAWAVQVIA